MLFQEAQDLWLLDMQGTNSGIMLLVAAANSQASTQLHYALGTQQMLYECITFFFM